MQSIINITTGTAAFPAHPGGDKIAVIVQGWLNKAGITAAVNVTETDSRDFLRVNGIICRFPATLNSDVETALAEIPAKDDKYWQYFIEQILWLQPQLFCTEQLVGELAAFKKNDDQISNTQAVMKELLQLKIAVPGINSISDKASGSKGAATDEEELIDRYSHKEIYIFVNPGGPLFAQNSGGNNLFELMRDGLFYETGIIYPPFSIVPDETLAPDVFYFQINNYTSLPFAGIDNDTILVNDKPERLKLFGIDATPATNPANGYAASFVSAIEKATLEKAGFTTWDRFGYCILCFSSFLRNNGYICVTQKLVKQYIEKLRLYYPLLAELILEQNQLPLITKVLRRLAKEQLSIRNMKLILEAVADFGWIKADDQENIIFDERVSVHTLDAPSSITNNDALVTEYVRTKMKRYISHMYTRGQSTLIVYLLDKEIEKLLMDAAADDGTLSPVDEANILAATAVEFEFTNTSVNTPIVLTTQTVRPAFKRLVENEYPKVVVLSYQELSPEMNIQPIARISLG